MGKSGHIARKIAATFACTGTPAQFVHPAEASHGDLGMVMRGDVVLVLSNSGETPELADIVAHTRRFGIPLIGVAGRERVDAAAAGRRGDPAAARRPRPAIPGIVPTTSTTMTLALGDALAIALMEHRAVHPRPVPHLPPRRQAGRAAGEGARPDARRHAAGAAARADERGAAGDHAARASAWWA